MVVDVGSIRLGFAFWLGTATFFAPCAFPLLPGYVAYFLGRETDDERPVGARLRRALTVGLLTSLGFVVVYALLAGLAVSVGTRTLRNVTVLELVAGVVLVALGSAMASGVVSPGSLHVALPERRRTPAGFFGFGVVYAAAAAGCTAPLFIALVSVALTTTPAGAVALLGAYAGGMSLLMIGVTLLTALGRDAVLTRVTANTGTIARVAGVVVVATGLLQIYFFLFRFDGLETLGLA
jgi:cytochrome c-type biogenesis protein